MPGSFSENLRWYVRHDNATSKEVARATGLWVGKELTCTGSGGTAVSYTWLRNGTPIAGATGASYTVAPADAGSVIQCQVVVSTGKGTALETTVPPLIVAPYYGKNPPYFEDNTEAGAATVATANYGFAGVGESLTCEANEWKNDPAFAFQWFRDGLEIAGADAATYVTGADADKGVQCRVTASNADGTAVGFSRVIPVHVAPPFATESPTITNTSDPGAAPEVGDELTCAAGTWTRPATFSYQWLRNGTPVGGATTGTYTVVVADEGQALQCIVTAAAPGATAQATSNQLVADPQPGVAPPTDIDEFSLPGVIYGGGQVPGESLSCVGLFSWSGEPTVTFQWLRDGTPIPGETNEYIETSAADEGHVLQCEVTATNAGGTTAAIYAGAENGPRYIAVGYFDAKADLPTTGLTYAGTFGGQVFFSDKPTIPNDAGVLEQQPSDLFSFDIADGTTTKITGVGDAKFSHVSRDGSHVYFVSKSAIGPDVEVPFAVGPLPSWGRSAHGTRDR